MVQWNEETNAKFLKALIKRAKFTKSDYEAIAKEIGCTPKAIAHRVYKYSGSQKDGQGKSSTARPASTQAAQSNSTSKANGSGKPSKTSTKPNGAQKRKRSESPENGSGSDAGDSGASKLLKVEEDSEKKIKYEEGNGSPNEIV